MPNSLQDLEADIYSQLRTNAQQAAKQMPADQVMRAMNEAFLNLAQEIFEIDENLGKQILLAALTEDTAYALPQHCANILVVSDSNDQPIRPISYESQLSQRSMKGFEIIDGQLYLRNANSGTYTIRFQRSPAELHYGVVSRGAISGTGNTSSVSTPTIVTAIDFSGDDDDEDATTVLAAGMSVSGDGIPSGTTILSVDSATQITLSANATATGTGVALSFSVDSKKIFFDEIGEGTGNIYAVDDYYNGMGIVIYDGTGKGQSRKIIDFVAESDSGPGYATVDSAWTTSPNTTSHYSVRPFWPSEFDPALKWETISLLPIDQMAMKAMERPAYLKARERLLRWAARKGAEGGNFGGSLSANVLAAVQGQRAE